MATPKKDRNRRRKGKSLNVWIEASIRDGLDEAVRRSRPQTTVRNLVEFVMGEWLRGQGILPPAENTEAP